MLPRQLSTGVARFESLLCSKSFLLTKKSVSCAKQDLLDTRECFLLLRTARLSDSLRLRLRETVLKLGESIRPTLQSSDERSFVRDTVYQYMNRPLFVSAEGFYGSLNDCRAILMKLRMAKVASSPYLYL
jgi:hypothetical protein